MPHIKLSPLAILLLLPLVYAQSPSSPSVKRPSEATRTIPFEKPAFEQRRKLLSVPASGCTTLSIRSLDSESTAILVHGARPDGATGEKPEHFRDERIVTCTWDNQPAHVLERDRTGPFAQWNAYLLSWEPGGRSLLVAAEFDGGVKWFRVDPFAETGRFTFQDPVISDCNDCDSARWMMEPRYTIRGTMHPVPSKQSPRLAEDERETGRSTHFDVPVVGGVTQTIDYRESTAFVDQRSGTLIIATAETIHFSKQVRAAIIDSVLLFNWNGRALAATWTTERYGDLLIPGVPGAFRTIDLGPDTVHVKPIARLTTKVLLLVDDGEKTELLQVQP